MAQETFDVVVAGLGATGSAAVAELARRGKTVLGLDRFRPPHDQGSSHGDTRVIREAYFEHPLYVPLVQRAYERWRELEKRRGRPLLETTGALLVGADDGVMIEGARASARQHGLASTELTATEIRRRYPVLHPDSATVGLLEPRAGVLFPEACIRAFLNDAAEGGAELRFAEPLLEWRSTQSAIEIRTDHGWVSAGRLILASGAWIPELVPVLARENAGSKLSGADPHQSATLEVERQVMHWVEPAERQAFQAGVLPVFLFAESDGVVLYGLPDFGGGLKVALHHGGCSTTASSLNREVAKEDVDALRRVLAKRIPTADRQPLRSVVCMYTNTADGHFLIDEHPEHPRMLVASACSGHGFKFASVLGEILADLVVDGETAFDLAPFRLSGRRSSS